MTTPKEILERVNASDFETLHRSRWSKETAEETVSALTTLLSDPDPKLVADALRALQRIGPEAAPATAAVVSAFSHAEPNVRRAAISACASVSLERPGEVIPALIRAAGHPELLEAALVSLVAFGPAADEATTLFCRIYGNKSTKLRRLAVRGLVACKATDAESLAVIRKARSDASAEVRKAAERVRS